MDRNGLYCIHQSLASVRPIQGPHVSLATSIEWNPGKLSWAFVNSKSWSPDIDCRWNIDKWRLSDSTDPVHGLQGTAPVFKPRNRPSVRTPRVISVRICGPIWQRLVMYIVSGIYSHILYLLLPCLALLRHRPHSHSSSAFWLVIVAGGRMDGANFISVTYLCAQP